MLPAVSADERKEAKYDGTYNAVLAVLRSAPKGLSMAELQIDCKRVSQSSSRRMIQEITETMLEDGLVEYLFEGARKKYILTDDGKKFDLTIE
jgi:predicted transcriptional regulator